MSIYLVNRAQVDSAMLNHSIEVTNEISLTLLQLRRAESAERGYLITQQDAFITDFQEAASRVEPTLDRLRELTSDNPVQIGLLAKLAPLITTRLNEFHEVIELTRSGKANLAIEKVRVGVGLRAMNEIRELTEQMRAEEDRLAVARESSARLAQISAGIVTIAGSALVIILGAISLLLVRRSAKIRDKAESQLRDYNRNLETMVEERTADFKEANEEIQRFAYIVSHDLRAPLVNIMGFTSELEEIHGDVFKRVAAFTQAEDAATAQNPAEPPQLSAEDRELSDSYLEALRFIKSSITKMDRLISAILNLTREGRREFRPEWINMNKLVQTAANSLAHQVQELGAEIVIEQLPDIQSDRLALEQIFSNLLDNAVKYLRPDIPGQIIVRGRRKLGFLVYEVADNGRGIAEKDFQRIFDLFRRSGAQDRPGDGIGLAHVRAFASRLGGKISVSSKLGEGSTFTIMLPSQWTTRI